MLRIVSKPYTNYENGSFSWNSSDDENFYKDKPSVSKSKGELKVVKCGYDKTEGADYIQFGSANIFTRVSELMRRLKNKRHYQPVIKIKHKKTSIGYKISEKRSLICKKLANYLMSKSQ